MNAKVSLVALALFAAGCTKDSAPSTPEGPWTQKVTQGKDLYATIKTSMGPVVVKLFSKEAPKTVKNFVGLATGEKDWKHPATGEMKHGVALYPGTPFHRVIDGFMIQGGDPLGSGTGDPGYRFEDEVNTPLTSTFTKVGQLAMANAGPSTNGSQFFITTSVPTYLNGKHTIFGEVVKGYEVVDAISKVPRDRRDKPLQPVVIEQITLSDTQP